MREDILRNFGRKHKVNKEQITAEVLAAFALPEGQLKELAPYGSGHINDTFRVTSNIKNAAEWIFVSVLRRFWYWKMKLVG